jgi:propanol-preferring alcohol dehydrogenase
LKETLLRAMSLQAAGQALKPLQRADPLPGPGQVRLRVRACGVCRTDLHIVDGELPLIHAPITPGHEIVGIVDAVGAGVTDVRLGERLGAPWLGRVCGHCSYCLEGAENLCDEPVFTGWTRDGGFADVVIVDAHYAFPIPAAYSDQSAAPLLCAGLIGFRSWRKACEARPVKRLGLYGFGAAGHLLAQLAAHAGQEVFAFVRPGDESAAALARTLGCVWVGGSDEAPPWPLDAAIIFASVGDLVPAALAAVRKGGTVVCGGIHMSDVPAFPYERLWGERRLVSVANLTRQDALDYLPLAATAKVMPHVTVYPLSDANQALDDLRSGRLVGAAVLKP